VKYLIKAKLKPAKSANLFEAIKNGTLGAGSVAFGEYERNMKSARVLEDGTLCWVEICFCETPLNEEQHYWEEYFEDITIVNAQEREFCLDASGALKRACFECDCTETLEDNLSKLGKPFIS
jgi:hypothetical protein